MLGSLRPPGRRQVWSRRWWRGWPGPASPRTWSRSPARSAPSPSAVLLIGTGQLFWGAVAVTFFVLLDMLDGALARARGGGSVFGAVLDSAGDRAADAAIFGALVWWFSGAGDNRLLVLLALLCLVLGVLTSYIKARAEGVGLSCDVGIVERTERLILVLVGTGFTGLGIPYALHVGAVGAARRQRDHGRPALPRRPPGRGRPAPPAVAAAAPSAVTGAGAVPRSTAAADRRRVRRRLARGPAAARAGRPAAFDRAGRWAAGRDGKGVRQLRANLRVVTGGRLTEPELADLTTPGRALLRPLLAGGLPAARAEQRADRRRHRGRRPRAPAEGAARRAAAWSWPCRTAGTGTPPAVWFIDWLGGPFMTVAERLKPESLYRAVPRLPGVPRHAGRAADRRPAAEHRGAARVAGRRRRRLPAGRPRTSAAAACRSTFFGRPATMPGGAGAARRRRPAPALIPTVCQFTERGWRLVVLARRCPSTGRAGCKDRVGAAMQARGRRLRRVDRRAARGLAHARPDLGRRAARTRPRTRGAPPDAHRPGLPLPVGRPRRRPVPRARPGRDAARDGPPRRGAHAGRARGVAAPTSGSPSPGAPCRCPTTARWPACSSARSRPRGCAAGCARGTSTSSTCTSRRRRRCPCWSA